MEPGNAQGRLPSMLEGFAKAGRAAVYRYTLDETVVAMDLCIESAGTLVILKPVTTTQTKAFRLPF
ncbi:GNAT family N-acetyltransferase [Roseateles sp. GG27B]